MSTTNENISTSSLSDAPTEELATIVEGPTELLRRTLSTLSETLSAIPDADQFEEFDQIQESAKELGKKVKNLERIRKEYGEKAMLLSFSNVTKDHLKNRLGVEIHPKTVTISTFEQVLLFIRSEYHGTEIDAEKKAYNPTKWEHDHLKTLLWQYEKYILPNHEASARVIVDIWLFALAQYMADNDLTNISIIHELSIASSEIKLEDADQTLPESSKEKNETASLSNDSDCLVVVRFGQHVTVLSGTADYAIFVATGKPTPNLSKISGELTYRKLVSMVSKASKRTGSSGLVNQVLVIEAKNTKEVLANHLPQVVAQCIAMSKIQEEKGPVEPLLFCLTNGNNWIFGLIVHLQPASTLTESQSDFEHEHEPNYRVYISPSIGPIHANNARVTEIAATKNYHLLVETLLIWAKVKGETIQKAFDAVLRD